MQDILTTTLNRARPEYQSAAGSRRSSAPPSVGTESDRGGNPGAKYITEDGITEEAARIHEDWVTLI